ncbi:hypothetical protein C8Q78DRAFT_988732 [Trametes maxima]|nr:hypothetical protein C8Q78DRAFT_988732 [Trametes maxima]
MGKSQNEELKEESKGDKCQTEVGCRSLDRSLAQMMEKENLMEFWSGSWSEQMSDRRMSKYDRKGLEGTGRAETSSCNGRGWSSLGVTEWMEVWVEFQNSGPGWHRLHLVKNWMSYGPTEYCWTNCHTEVVTVFRNLLALTVINSHVFGSFGEELSGEWGKQGGHHPSVELMFLQITTVFRTLAPPIVAQFPRILSFDQELRELWAKQSGPPGHC